MPRPRKEQPSKRLTITLDAEDAERLDAHAEALGRPPATAAARLLTAALQRAEHDPVEEQLVEAQGTVRRLQNALLDLESKARARDQVAALSRPRWAQSMQAILDDGDWWDAWLPELYALLGRQLEATARDLSSKSQVLDERGYADLLTFLFPPLVDRRGSAITWRHPDYAHFARLDWESARRPREGGSVATLTQAPSRPVRAEVWEPVIRHIAKALALLESTSEPDTDPYLRMRADDEIRGGWLRTLGALIGHGDKLQPDRVPASWLA